VGTYLRVIDRSGERYVPRQQFVDLADVVVSDALEDVLEVELRVESVELCGAEQGVDVGSALATLVGACEEEVLAFM